MIVFDKGAKQEEYTTFDRGDLCNEIDTRIGDLIERTAHRYLLRDVAKEMRREIVEDMADRIIAWDADHGKGNSYPSKR